MYKNILFVEDEIFAAEMYAEALKATGFEVDIELDGKKGYERAATGKYDLVLLDLMLPNMTGLEILRKLRDTNQSPSFTPNHHVVILTNLDEDDITKREIFKLAQGYHLKVDIVPRRLAVALKNMDSTNPEPIRT